MTITRIFGLVVREERTERCISQEELAERAELHRNAIGLIERGERTPSLESLFAIAKGLDLQASELLVRLERRMK